MNVVEVTPQERYLHYGTQRQQLNIYLELREPFINYTRLEIQLWQVEFFH